MKVKLAIEGAECYVTDEKPGTPKHPKLIVGGVSFGPDELVTLPGHSGMHIAAQIAFTYGQKLEGAERSLCDEFIRPML